MHMMWSRIHEPLVKFLLEMVDMPENVRKAAIEVADACGRYNRDKYYKVWTKLKGGTEGEKDASEEK